MNEMQKISNAEDLYVAIASVLNETRSHISRAVNSSIVSAYWSIGKYLIDFEQNGRERAKYGDSTITELSLKLQTEFGSGFTPTNLRYMRQFYLLFPNYHTVCDKLSWSHYRALLKIDNEQVRLFYMNECASSNWTVRQLERQINTRFYERLIASKDKAIVRNEITANTNELTPKEIIRDPYILEFLQIPQSEHFLESDLERMLISKLQHFLLELGKGFSFVARQKRISFDDKHFYRLSLL